jgi:hypothetical protein
MKLGGVRERSDPDLVRAARRGDRDAAATLFRRYWPTAWRAALVLTGRRAMADDVASDAFERHSPLSIGSTSGGRSHPGCIGSSLTARSTFYGLSVACWLRMSLVSWLIRHLIIALETVGCLRLLGGCHSSGGSWCCCATGWG